MEESKGGGFPWLVVLVVVIVLAVAIGCGAPVISGSGLTWDNSGWINAQNQKTRREQIQANRDVRVAEEWNATMQQVVLVAGAVGVVLAAGWAVQRSVSAWAARPHRPVPAPPAVIVMMASAELAAAPEARLEYSEEDGAWVIVNERTKTVKLLEDHSATPRRLT